MQVEFGGCGLIKPTLKFNTWIYYMIGHMTCESIRDDLVMTIHHATAFVGFLVLRFL